MISVDHLAEFCAEHSFNIEFRSAHLVFCPLGSWDSTASWQFLFQCFIFLAVVFFPFVCIWSAAPLFSLLLLSPTTYIIEEPCSVVQATSSGIGRFFTSESQNVGCSLKWFCACSFFSFVVENYILLFNLWDL